MMGRQMQDASLMSSQSDWLGPQHYKSVSAQLKQITAIMKIIAELVYGTFV